MRLSFLPALTFFLFVASVASAQTPPSAASSPPPAASNAAKVVPGTYALDKNHASILFKISHLGFSMYHGRFDNFDMKLDLNPAAPEQSKIEATIDTSSIDTHNAKLEGELKDVKFFNVAKFPTATFKSTKISKTGEDTAILTGDLTMLGATHPITLNVKFHGGGIHPMSKKPVVGFAAVGVIKRSQWGMSELVPMVGDEVQIDIDAEFTQSTAAEAPPPQPPAVPPEVTVPAPAPAAKP
jgi:polyisoprenoid-binding protein YceI